MHRDSICFLLLTALSLSPTLCLSAQEKPADKMPEQPKLMGLIPGPPPAAGFRAEFLEELAYYAQRYARLAEAMPAEKYSWRPINGVRSVGEVYTHVIMANYGVGKSLVEGQNPAARVSSYGWRPEDISPLVSNKAELLKKLKSSFDQLRDDVLLDLSDGDADKPQKMFNRQTTVRGALMMIDRHWGEHLGQSIAYARVNGVVPPWTEEFQQQQKTAEKPKP